MNSAEMYLWVLLLLGLLFPLVLIDLRSQILPNKHNMLLAGFGLIHSYFTENPEILEALVGGFLAGAVMFVVAKSYKKVRKIDGLGLGDVKLAAAGGLWVGWSMVGLMILLGALSAGIFGVVRGIILKKFDPLEKIPFGPFLAFGILAAWVIRHVPSPIVL